MGFLSDIFGITGAKRAASNAATSNRNESNAAWQDANSIQQPYLQQGQQSYGLLNNFLGVNGQGAQQNAFDNYVMGPDVQFRMNQGINALDNSYAARTGGTDSGALRKAQINYGTGIATQDKNNYLQQLLASTGVGQNAANALTNSRYQSAGLTTGANTAEGNAIANASLAGGNLLMGGLGLGANLLGMGGFGGTGGWNPFSQQGTMNRQNDPWGGLR